MTYLHFEIESAQNMKANQMVCGDLLSVERSESATTLICADGIGSGSKAHIAATMCVARLKQLLADGVSLRESFERMVHTINTYREPDLPYVAFTLARTLSDGQCTILSYDAPVPLFISGCQVHPVRQRTWAIDDAMVGEAICHMKPGESVLMMSDGISQAGLGKGMGAGWGETAVCEAVSKWLRRGMIVHEIPDLVVGKAKEFWGGGCGDDCTAALISCRKGTVVNVFTGPPAVKANDRKIVSEFMKAEGLKIVCGAMTAKIVADYLGKEVSVRQDFASSIAPPYYEVEGIDLVTEGTVTLNQLYNVIDEDPNLFEPDSGVTELFGLLNVADRINMTVGVASNPANVDIAFRQRGILPRGTIVGMLAEKLRSDGKLVVVKHV